MSAINKHTGYMAIVGGMYQDLMGKQYQYKDGKILVDGIWQDINIDDFEIKEHENSQNSVQSSAIQSGESKNTVKPSIRRKSHK